MASIATRTLRTQSLSPDRFEKILAVGAALLFAALLAALTKGRAEWAHVPLTVWGHLLTIAIALMLTPIMLLRPRGDALHRKLGYVWVAAMGLTALISFSIHEGGFSIIHILSVWTLIQVPVIAWSAHSHNIKRHRGSVRGMVTGALLIAGFFTFPFDRLLGHWLFS